MLTCHLRAPPLPVLEAEEERPLVLQDLPHDVLSDLLGHALLCAPLGVRLLGRSFRAAADAGRRTLRLRGGAGSDQDSAAQVAALLRRLPQLQGLDCSGCWGGSFTFLATSPPSLTSLGVAPTHSFGVDFSPLTRFTALRSLSLAGNPSINSITALASFPRLTSVDLSGCHMRDVAPLSTLTVLSCLTLNHCRHVGSLAALAHCPTLVALHFAGCLLDSHLPDITLCAPHLEVLSLADARSQQGQSISLSPLTRLAALRSLDLSAIAPHILEPPGYHRVCPACIESLAFLAGLPSLSALDVRGSSTDYVHGQTALTSLTRLRSLRLSADAAAASAMMAQLSFLTALDAGACNVTTSADVGPRTLLLRLSDVNNDSRACVSWPTPCAALLSLHMGSGPASLPPSGPSSLTALHLPSCTSLITAAPLLTHPSLTSINLQGCQEVTDLDLLPSAVCLQHLSLLHCRGVTDVGPLADCAALEVVDVRGTRVASLAPLAACTRLRSLQVDSRYIPHLQVERLVAALATGLVVGDGRWVPE